MSPLVSVIIPVRNDRVRLARCLKALSLQTYPSSSFEVIVVDNGSVDQPELAVEGRNNARLLREHRSGSYMARNAGVSAARGEVVAFTDSDCDPDESWIERGVAALQSAPDVGMVGGRIEVFFADPKAPTPVERYEAITAFPQQQYVLRDGFAATANMFTYRALFEKLGPFAASLKSGGDREWGQRLSNAGYRAIYAPEACVRHPARRTFEELRDKLIRVRRGLEDQHSDRRLGWRECLFWVRRLMPVRFLLRILTDQRLGTIRERIATTAVMLYVRYATAWHLLSMRPRKVSRGG